MSEQGENESGDDENNEWEENSEEVNIENDDEVHKDEEAIEGETETPVDVLGTQAPVKLDQEKTEEKENQTQNEIPTEDKVTENKNSEIILIVKCVQVTEIKKVRNQNPIQKWW